MIDHVVTNLDQWWLMILITLGVIYWLTSKWEAHLKNPVPVIAVAIVISLMNWIFYQNKLEEERRGKFYSICRNHVIQTASRYTLADDEAREGEIMGCFLQLMHAREKQ